MNNSNRVFLSKMIKTICVKILHQDSRVKATQTRTDDSALISHSKSTRVHLIVKREKIIT